VEARERPVWLCAEQAHPERAPLSQTILLQAPERRSVRLIKQRCEWQRETRPPSRSRLHLRTVTAAFMDDQVPKVPPQMPPRPTMKLPSLTAVGPAVMFEIHPTLSGASLVDGLAAEKEPDRAGKHPLQNHVPTLPKCAN
jgi:hypothetical protein